MFEILREVLRDPPDAGCPRLGLGDAIPGTSSDVKSPITCSMSGWTAGRSKTVTVTETPSCPLKIRKVSQKLANTSAEGVT